MKIGDKVYYDCFGGLCKAVVVGLPDDSSAEIKITSRKHMVYKQGEVILTSKNWAIPRENVFIRDGFYWIRGSSVKEVGR